MEHEVIVGVKSGLVCYGFRISQEDRSTMYKLEDLSSGRYVYVGSKMNAIDLELELEVLRFF